MLKAYPFNHLLSQLYSPGEFYKTLWKTEDRDIQFKKKMSRIYCETAADMVLISKFSPSGMEVPEGILNSPAWQLSCSDTEPKQESHIPSPQCQHNKGQRHGKDQDASSLD